MYAKVASIIKDSKSFLLVSHYNPDGDALGSSMALGLGLQHLGKKVCVYNRDKVPYNLFFLPKSTSIQSELPRESVDCVIMLDCAQPKRVSDDFKTWLEKKKYKHWLCIDHHLLDQAIGDVDLIDPKAAATGEVVWKLLKTLKVSPTPEIATHIYTTLVVDTGFFKYSNTTSHVLRLAADLLEIGADPWLVAQNIEESNPKERYLLLGQSLRSLEFALDGKLSFMEVTQEMFETAGAKEGDAEEFATYPRAIDGVEVAVLFRETSDRRLKVSLRSKNKVDVSQIAKTFGGGGHKHAAGCYMQPPIGKAKKILSDAIRDALKKA